MALLHPESDLTLSPIALGAVVLRALSGTRAAVLVDDLLNSFLSGDRRRTPSAFFDTLDFLYAIGAISKSGYRIKLATQPKLHGHIGDLFGDDNA